MPEDAGDGNRYSLLAKKIDGAAAGRIFQDGRAFFSRLSLGEYELILEQDGFESGRYRFLAGREGILER